MGYQFSKLENVFLKELLLKIRTRETDMLSCNQEMVCKVIGTGANLEISSAIVPFGSGFATAFDARCSLGGVERFLGCCSAQCTSVDFRQLEYLVQL